MGPEAPLPLDAHWKTEDEYLQSLLSFATGSDIFRNLCGGVHILDFLTREPDLYSTVLPREWREWFDGVSVDDVLDLLLREDLDNVKTDHGCAPSKSSWRDLSPPPASLIEYIAAVRSHCLVRHFQPLSNEPSPMAVHITVGMKPKKIHEVSNFAAYVDRLSKDLAKDGDDQLRIVDFGSGQNYLGRTLACPPYNRHVIAIEQRHHNIDGAKGMDIHAKLSERELIMRNKKEYKKQLALTKEQGYPSMPPQDSEISQQPLPNPIRPQIAGLRDPSIGSMAYIEHVIDNGYLESVLYPSNQQCHTPSAGSSTPENSSPDRKAKSDHLTAPHRPPLLVVSLHSCGNLIHHGLRSLILNRSVRAVAMIGCCYNLMTERLGPATYKLPQLRPNHPRLESISNAFDPHGFPMSQTLENFTYTVRGQEEKGVRLNITARMMAVQAPHNWGPKDCADFFTRHFYRALFQRVLLDVGVVQQRSTSGSDTTSPIAGGNLSSDKDTTNTEPSLIIGSLGKTAFTSFGAYVRAAVDKLTSSRSATPNLSAAAKSHIRHATTALTDATLTDYETRFHPAKKNLALIWSLMAFSAGVVESLVAVDRWLFLREQQPQVVERCWVEPVFDYHRSPRNLVVVGIKKSDV